MKKKLVLFGASEHTKLVHYYFSHYSNYEIAGFVADREYVTTDRMMELPLINFDQVETQFPPDQYDMFVAIGYRSTNTLRASKYALAKQKGYHLATFVHPSSYIDPSVRIGDNCLVLENCILQPFVTIGDNVIIWSGAHLGHHSCVDHHCFLAPRVALSGHVTVHEQSFIGINSTIRDHVTIAARNIIGAGSTILQNTSVGEVYKANSPFKLEISSDQVKNI